MTLIRLEFVKHLNVIQILIHIQYRLNVYQVKVTFTPVLKLIIKHNIQPPSVGLWRQIQVRHNLFNNHRAVNRSVTDTIVKWTVKDWFLLLKTRALITVKVIYCPDPQWWLESANSWKTHFYIFFRFFSVNNKKIICVGAIKQNKCSILINWMIDWLIDWTIGIQVPNCVN